MNTQTKIKILTTQLDRLYADNEFCQHEEEIDALETQLKTLKTCLEQKPVTKNSVVCTIAAKLAKSGVKNPMNAAWNLYRATLKMLHAINAGNVKLARYIAKQIKTKIYGLDATSIITDFFEYKTAEFIIVLAR